MSFDKQALRKDIERHHKQAARSKLSLLRKAVQDARHWHRAAMQDVRRQCKDIRLNVRVRIKEMRARARKQLAAIALRERAKATDLCRRMKADARAKFKDAISRQRANLEAERSFQRELRRIEHAAKVRAAEHPHASYLERKSESDDLVRANIPSDLIPLFERIKNKIRGNAKMSRTETFLHYVEEHPDEQLAAIEHEAHQQLRRLERQHAEERKASKRARLADVPF